MAARIGDGVDVPSGSAAMACTRPILPGTGSPCHLRLWPIAWSAAIQRGVEARRVRPRSRRGSPAGGSAAPRPPSPAARSRGRARAAPGGSSSGSSSRRAFPRRGRRGRGIDRDRRAHRREHPLAGRDRVDLALDEAVHVLLARPRREVVHLVVHQEAEAGRDARVAEGVVQRRRHRDDHALRGRSTEKCVVVGFSGSPQRELSADGVARSRVDRGDQALDARGIGEAASRRRRRKRGRRGNGCGRGTRASRSRRASAADAALARAELGRADELGGQRHLREHRARRGRRRREDLGARGSGSAAAAGPSPRSARGRRA